jgi:hypothetical protein
VAGKSAIATTRLVFLLRICHPEKRRLATKSRPGSHVESDIMFDIHRSIVDPESGEIDRKAFEDYSDDLMEEFASSPEGQAFCQKHGEVGWAAMMMEYALDYPGVTPPEMSLGDFDEVVFELFPRKVSTEAESAEAIVAELKAFWEFLRRAYNLNNAGPILATLTPAAVRELEKELANPANFGMAKSFFMKGQELGFDMTTQEGMNAFMLYYNSHLAGTMPPPAMDFPRLPDDDYLPPLGPGLPRGQRQELRKKKKAQRQARKRNRRKK